MSDLSREYLEALAEAATEQITAAALDVVKFGLLDADGLAYGDVEHKNEAEFAGWYLDLYQRGVLVHLQVVAPHFAERWRKKFERITAQMMEPPKSRYEVSMLETERMLAQAMAEV